jgi:hypothetical protein
MKHMYNGWTPWRGALPMTCGQSVAVRAWIKEWVKVVATSPMMALPEHQRPKLVVLHAESAKTCASYGGASAGIFTELTAEDWSELLPLPNWRQTSRSAYTENVRLEVSGSNIQWAGTDNWKGHQLATKDAPSPTSSRFFIISTNNSWKHNVAALDDERSLENDGLKAIRTALAKEEKVKDSQAHRVRLAKHHSDLRDQLFTTLLSVSGRRDRQLPNQATREMF